MNGVPQVANPFAMNNSHLENAALEAGRQVIRDKFLYLSRMEIMQIQNSINGKLNGLVHHPSS